MFGRKKEKSEAKVESKLLHNNEMQNNNANTSNCGGKCSTNKNVSSTKASDMTSGSRSTKSCGGKCSSKSSSSKAASNKSATSKAGTTKSASAKTTKSCS